MMKPGEFVRHANQPSWGMGKVLELVAPDKVKIRFASVGEKVLVVTAAALEAGVPTASEEKLLTGRSLRARKPLAAPKSHDALVAAFLARFPGGFASPEYAKAERDSKVKAHELARHELEPGKLAAARDEGRFDDVVESAMRVLNSTTLVFPNEKIALRNGLTSPVSREQFSRTLIDLLYGDAPYQARFVAFTDVLLGFDAGKWTLATYFPFLVHPREHMFLKPQVTQKAADAYGFALAYDAQPNWNTYEKLLAFCALLSEKLAPLGPADMFDVQSFLWAAGNEAGTGQ
jgi:hypothetical protein